MSLRRGALWFAAGLLLALLAGGIAMTSLQRAVNSASKPVEVPTQAVLIATRDIPLHTVLAPGDFQLSTVPKQLVPADGVTDPKEALGKLTTADIAQGEIILARRLIAPDYVGPNAAMVMDPKQVIVAFEASSLLPSLNIVRPGDRVDIMYTQDFSKVKAGATADTATLDVLQDVRVAAVIRGAPKEGQSTGPVTALLLALDPQDALTLKYFRDMGGIEALALRSPAADRGPFDVTPVNGDYVFKRYGIQWQSSSK